MVFGFSLIGASLGLQRSMEVGVLFVGSSVVKIIVVLALLVQGVGLMALPYSDLGSALWVVSAGTALLWRGLRQYKHAEGRIGMERLSELAGLFMFSLGARLGKVSIAAAGRARLLRDGHDEYARARQMIAWYEQERVNAE